MSSTNEPLSLSSRQASTQSKPNSGQRNTSSSSEIRNTSSSSDIGTPAILNDWLLTRVGPVRILATTKRPISDELVRKMDALVRLFWQNGADLSEMAVDGETLLSIRPIAQAAAFKDQESASKWARMVGASRDTKEIQVEAIEVDGEVAHYRVQWLRK